MPIENPPKDFSSHLTPAERAVLQGGGTEARFSGKYVENHDAGMYTCKACGNVLFSSETKFDSGTGWPSFSDVAVASNVGTREDGSHGMSRTEVYCKQCNGHLGHVFPDGPEDRGGKRYCINSISLDFKKE